MTAPLVRLDEVCTITMGQAPKGESYNDGGRGIPLIAGAGDFNGPLPRAKKFTTSPTKRCSTGDIVLAIRASIGQRVWADRDYCLGRGVAGLRPRDGLDPKYLWHWLGCNSGALAAKGKGATFKQVNREDISELTISLPPIDEQRRTAAILDQADALRAKRRESLTLLDDLTRSIFVEAVTTVVADSWPIVTVAEVAGQEKGSIRTGPFGSQLLHSEFVDEGIAVLGIDNAVNNEFRWAERRFITERKYQSLRRYTVRPGDVVVTIMGTCGRCAVIPNDIPLAINTKHLCCITLDQTKCLPEFLHASFQWQPLSRRALERATKGAVMDGLNMGLIKAMPMRLPPLEEQIHLVHRLRAVSKLRQSHARSLEHSDRLFDALQAWAFSGRL